MSSTNVPQTMAESWWLPSIELSERYDTNVFLIDEDRLPGRDLADFVTTLAPSIAVPLRRQDAQGNARVGANLNYYANNPELNFIGVEGLLDLQLDGWAGRFIKGFELSLVEKVSYTPEPPAFFRPDEETRLTDPANIGIQTARANTFRNSVSVQAAYPLSPLTGLQGSYRNTIVRFGEQDVPASQQSLLDTRVHAGTLGYYYRTQRGTVGLNLQGSDQDSGNNSFQTAGATISYDHMLSPTLSWSLAGGATAVDQARDVEVRPIGSTGLRWRGQRSTAALVYSRSIVPNTTVQAAALINDNVAASLGYALTQTLSLAMSANYARNDTVLGDAGILFQSAGSSITLTQELTRAFAIALSHQYSNFEINQDDRITTAFDRHVATLSLTATWN